MYVEGTRWEDHIKDQYLLQAAMAQVPIIAHAQAVVYVSACIELYIPIAQLFWYAT